MNGETYEIEIITPCFCAGADQARAEIRVPSIRGQLRWWFRALGGTREQEKKVFGGVHRLEGERKEDAARRSGLLLRLAKPVASDIAWNLEDMRIDRPGNARGYLLWPLRPQYKKVNGRRVLKHDQRRGVLPAGTKFTLLTKAALGSGESEAAKLLGRATVSWLLLGSLGTRSRRGWGSLWPVSLRSGSVPSGVDAFRSHVAELLSGQPMIVNILSAQGHRQPEEALDDLGAWLHKWRVGSRKFGQNPKAWGENDHRAGRGKSDVVYRATLGLPLSQRYSSEPRLTVETELPESSRWASPVHMKVIRLGPLFYPLVVFFPEMAIPDGTSLVLYDLQQRRRNRDHRLYTVCSRHELFNEMMQPGPDELAIFNGVTGA